MATYIRFAVATRDPYSDQQQGVFQALYTLERHGALLPHEVEWFASITASSRPNAPDRAISWFKLSATEHVAHMRELVTLLEHKDIAVEEFRTGKPGYIVYEDEHQIAAIPFTNETF